MIDLQSAHVTQLTNEGVKGEWKVRKNITSEDIHTLPAHLSDEQVFGILNFAKKYELIAFNAGIEFQREKQKVFLRDKISGLETLLKDFTEENIRLAELLDSTLT